MTTTLTLTNQEIAIILSALDDHAIEIFTVIERCEQQSGNTSKTVAETHRTKYNSLNALRNTIRKSVEA